MSIASAIDGLSDIHAKQNFERKCQYDERRKTKFYKNGA